MLERTDDIDDAIANFAGLDFLEGREDEIWTPVFVMCDLFCPERRPELERAAADICAAKRAEPKKVSAAEAKRESEMCVAMESGWCGICWRSVATSLESAQAKR